MVSIHVYKAIFMKTKLTVKYYEQYTHDSKDPMWHEYNTEFYETTTFGKDLYLSRNRTLPLTHAYWGDWLRKHLRKVNKCFAEVNFGYVWGSSYFKNERVYI